jgi:hypothetical protein
MIEINGFWWLPQNPNQKIIGQLRYRFGSKPTLDLVGDLGDVENDFFDLVLGVCDEICYTIISCARINVSTSRSPEGNFTRTTYSVIAIIKGHHYEKIEDIDLNSLDVTYSHLKDWICCHLLNYTDYKVDDNNETVLTLKKPKSIDISLPTFNIQIKGTYNNSFGLFIDKLERNVVVNIYKSQYFSGKMTFIDALELIDNIRYFFTLLIDERINLTEIKIADAQNKNEIIIPSKMKEKQTKDHFRFCPLPVEANTFLQNLSFT